jgi:hypothetical protein
MHLKRIFNFLKKFSVKKITSIENIILGNFDQSNLKLLLNNLNLKSLEFNSIITENLNKIDLKESSIENLNLENFGINFTMNIISGIYFRYSMFEDFKYF